MNRYHKKVYFKHIKELSIFNDNINEKSWKYSSHALDNLKYRAIDNMSILKYIRDIKLVQREEGLYSDVLSDKWIVRFSLSDLKG